MEKAIISNTLRKQVFKRDNYTCRYCGYTGGPLHADHVYPECKGGETTLENLVTACPNCNQRKSSKVGIWPMPIEQGKRLSESERHYQKTGMFVYALFFANTLQDRVRGIKAAFPKLSTNDIAVIIESSPAHVSQVLKEVEVIDG